MPYCKNCGSRITKFDKDICPVCGAVKPLEGSHSDTVEITSELDFHNKETRGEYEPHFKLNTFIYFTFLGWTGAGFFYLKFKKLGWVWLAANLVLLGGLTTIFIFTISPKSWITYVAPVAVIYLINIGIALYYLFKDNVRDGNGEFIH